MTTDPDEIIKGARGQIDRELLTETGTGGFLGDGYLAERPAISYLDDDEQLQFLLYNDNKGLQIGELETPEEVASLKVTSVRTLSQDKSYRALALVTSQRILFILGTIGGNDVIEVPLNRVAQADGKTGILKNKLVMRDDDKRYVFPTKKGGAVTDAAAYISNRAENLRGQQRSAPNDESTEPDVDTEQAQGMPTVPSDSDTTSRASADFAADIPVDDASDSDTRSRVSSSPADKMGLSDQEDVNAAKTESPPTAEQDDHSNDGGAADSVTTEAAAPTEDSIPKIVAEYLDDPHLESAEIGELAAIEADIDRLIRIHTKLAETIATKGEGDDIKVLEADLSQLETTLKYLSHVHMAIETAEAYLENSGSNENRPAAEEALDSLDKAVSKIDGTTIDESRLVRLRDSIEVDATVGTGDSESKEPDVSQDDDLIHEERYTGSGPYRASTRDHVELADDVSDTAREESQHTMDERTFTETHTAETSDETVGPSGNYGSVAPDGSSIESRTDREIAHHSSTSAEELLEDLRELHETLGRIPNSKEINKYGKFTHNEYVQTFGSIADAIDEAGLDYEEDILQKLRNVAHDLGHPPKPEEFDRKERYNSTSIYKLFDSWETALEAAGVSTEANLGGEQSEPEEKETDLDVQKIQQQSPHEDEKGTADVKSETEEGAIESNELAEYYEAVTNLRRVHHALYGGDPGDVLSSDDPMTRWTQLVSAAVGEEGISGWESGYGPQQRTRNEFSMNEYRTAFGNDEQVTEFTYIEVVDVPEAVATLVPGNALDTATTTLPVAPKSGHPLPVFVEDEVQLDRAHELLAELPAEPSADSSLSDGVTTVDSEGDSASDEDTEQPIEGDAIAVLTEVSGVTEGLAEALLDDGYETRADLKAASIDELEAVEGVSGGLAARIKADVGG